MGYSHAASFMSTVLSGTISPVQNILAGVFELETIISFEDKNWFEPALM